MEINEQHEFICDKCKNGYSIKCIVYRMIKQTSEVLQERIETPNISPFTESLRLFTQFKHFEKPLSSTYNDRINVFNSMIMPPILVIPNYHSLNRINLTEISNYNG